jgi:hypothetical protein
MIIILIMLLLFAGALITVPWVALEWRRALSRTHRPQPTELWCQGNALLYIESVDTEGVHWLTFDPDKQQLLRWTDTWSAWRERLRSNVLWFTGRTGSIDQWELMRT